jgi:hypothetical protein
VMGSVITYRTMILLDLVPGRESLDSICQKSAHNLALPITIVTAHVIGPRNCPEVLNRLLTCRVGISPADQSHPTHDVLLLLRSTYVRSMQYSGL